MSSGFSIDALEVDYSNNQDFLIIEPQSASYNESIEGFQGVVYEYEVYPLKKGKLRLKPWHINFRASMGYAQPKQTFTKTTKAIMMDISSVKGYNFLLASSSVKVKTTFDTKEHNFSVGDAITREILISAINVPDLLIAPIKTKHLRSVRIYKSEPILKQVKKNENIVASRLEKETYILNEEGNFTIESAPVKWYNVDTKKVDTEIIPAFYFSVKASEKKDGVIKEKKLSKKELLGYSAILLGLLFSLWVFFKLLQYLLMIYKVKKVQIKEMREKNSLVKHINPKYK